MTPAPRDELLQTDVDWELEHFGNARDLWAPVPTPEPEAVRVRSGGAVRGPAVSAGRQLVRRGGPVLQALFDQVLVVESLFGSRAHDVPLLLGAKTVEAAFYLTVIKPLEQGNPRRGIVPALLALVDADRSYPYISQNKEALNKWMGTRSRSVVTFGTVCQLVDVLQRFPGRLPADIEAVLRATFRADFVNLLLGAPGLKDALLRLNNLRNRVAHPPATPSAADYVWFKDAVVHHDTFRAWHEGGPRAAPPDHRGVLHHLLASLRPSFAPSRSPRADVFERLETVAPAPGTTDPLSPTGQLRVVAEVQHDDRPRFRPITRSVGLRDTSPGRPFRDGDSVRFRVQPNRRAWVRVIDCDPDARDETKSFTLLWPNPWDRERPLGPSEPLELPGASYPESFPGFHLQGGPGEKTLLVFTSESTLPRELDAASTDLRHVSAEDVLRWLDALGTAPGPQSAAVVRYRVEPRS